MSKNLPLIIVAFFIFSVTFAQSGSLWKVVNESELRSSAKVNRNSEPGSYKLFNLNLEGLRSVLAGAPVRGSFQGKSNLIIELPNAEGQLEQYRVMETPIMEPALAAKFPMIKSYAAQGIKDPTAVARFSVTQFGLHSMTLSAGNSTAFIDPYTENHQNYIVYSKSSLAGIANDFSCLTDDVSLKSIGSNAAAKVLNTDDKQLRTYRLAQSCTAEYGNIFAGTGTDAEKRANIQAQMAITMTRVNGVYEHDLAITMVFVANNDEIIYFGSTSADPWSGEYNSTTGEVIDEAIGFENYDIGHNFNTSGGGNAGCIGCVCSTDSNPNGGNHKGTGMTGRTNPTGDAFDIDYVAHEMGHQFGGFHTQSSSGCRSGSGLTEVEPGSGSTIMGYAGICAANVQPNSDAYFAYVNIRDILENVKNGVSSACAVLTPLSNNPPTAAAGNDYVIPKSTAYVLTGSGTDPDGDAITYNWEQNDPENPNSSAAPTPTRLVGPMYRSLTATTSPSRYMPNLATILAGNTANTFEANPSVARDLNFSLTVRDNVAGGGQTASDLMKVTVSADAGPFLLTSPNTATSLEAGSNQTVTWNVAGTDVNGINAKYVDIYMSSNGGTDFPALLASKVPNDGSEIVTIPNIPGAQNRIMIRAFDNIFFDVSNANFTNTPAEATFTAGFSGIAGEQNKTICTGSEVSYTLAYDAIEGFTGATTFTVTGNPAGSNATFSQPTLSEDGNVLLQITTDENTVAGFYTLVVTATSGAITKTSNYYLELFNADFDAVALTTPTNDAQFQGTTVTLDWETNSNATSYTAQVSATADFATIFASRTTSETNFTVSGLAQNTTYYWRVLPENISCSGTYGEAFIFTTGEISCTNLVATNVPVTISGQGAPTVTSILNVSGSGLISDINVTMDVTHTYISDMSATLVSPSGTEVLLYNSLCGDGNNLNATFDDSGVAVICGANPAVSGIVIPAQALSAFNGENANGNWTLRLEDGFSGDGGALNSWSIDVCAVEVLATTNNDAIQNFVIAPNPNSGSFNVKLDADSSQQVSIAINDLRGRQIFSKQYQGQTVFNENINLNVESGIYMVNVTNGEKKETKKIIIN